MIVGIELMGTPPNANRIHSIRVYKMVTNTNDWEEINNFDVNQALFLTPKESMFFPTTDGQEYKSNYIYFFEENVEGYIDVYGVYDFGNHRVRRFDLIAPTVGFQDARFYVFYNPINAAF